jgi:hypothetical protein
VRDGPLAESTGPTPALPGDIQLELLRRRGAGKSLVVRSVEGENRLPLGDGDLSAADSPSSRDRCKRLRDFCAWWRSTSFGQWCVVFRAVCKPLEQVGSVGIACNDAVARSCAASRSSRSSAVTSMGSEFGPRGSILNRPWSRDPDAYPCPLESMAVTSWRCVQR